ncbi:hypothetical protein ARMSODRAFT_1026584 [Armillaria solidipes]|uniref:Helitron helicase-like domain-containing protein n=1 Tax=Armillaria solidipes TaxID=1076256 RepID=A0A2H3AUJ1_9AGAR|nr:hypothetical protein ARMSODRAFT_1026584 [Armillaria solidipes]
MQDDFHIEISYGYTSSPSYLAQEHLVDLRRMKQRPHYNRFNYRKALTTPSLRSMNMSINVQTDSVADQFPLNQRLALNQCICPPLKSVIKADVLQLKDSVQGGDLEGKTKIQCLLDPTIGDLETLPIQDTGGIMSLTCKYCGIKVLTNEYEWQVFLSHRQLGASSCRLNSLFSLTALGVYDGDFMHFKSSVAAVTLNGGHTYHRLIPAQEGQHAIRWFLHEPGQRYLQGAEQSIPKNWIDAALAGLQRVNPFVKELQNLQTQDDKQMALHIEELSSIVGSNVTAIISLSPNAPPSRRTIVIKRVGEDHHRFLDLLSPYVEPLHYVLFFPYGTLGWAPGQQLTQT